MATTTTQQKWENLATLIKAKAEHKEKFNEIIEYKDYEDIWYYRSIKENIEEILLNHKWFITNLINIIQQKYHKYITERKITIPNLDRITEYNCETDCPICFETFGIDDDDATIDGGENCDHQICRECLEKIVNDTNRCPICRAVLDNDKENETESDNESSNGSQNTDEEYDDWRNEYYGATNIVPTTDLFLGRRWYNAIENRMYYRQNDTWIGSPCMNLQTFIERYNNWFRNHTNNNTCCFICGIQKTLDVNRYMRDVYNLGNDGDFDINNVDGDEPWEHYFGGGNGDECYDCYKKYEALSDNFNVMTNDGIWNQD